MFSSPWRALVPRPVAVYALSTSATGRPAQPPALRVCPSRGSIETLRLLRDGRCPRAAQDHILATYAPAIEPADTVVHWNEPATRVRDRIRAMAPRPGAATSIRGRRLKLWLAEARPGVGNTPGCVLAVARDGVEVAAGEGILLLREVQAENSRRMPASDWARGARIAAGDAFEACAER